MHYNKNRKGEKGVWIEQEENKTYCRGFIEKKIRKEVKRDDNNKSR